MVKIALLGDSILDNFYWLEDQENDLTKQLTNLGFEVGNFAVDESQIEDVLEGIKPRAVYAKARSYPYPSIDGRVSPLRLLKQFRPEVAVLSVGGNDLRVQLTLLMFGLEHFQKKVLDPLIPSYHRIIQEMLSRCQKVILVSFYIPYLGQGSNYQLLNLFGPSNLTQLATSFTNEIAKSRNLPVIELSSTFDCLNRSHYGSTEIEPSNLSSQCIADLIKYVSENYEGYKIYSAPNCEMRNLKVIE
jgi:hypothetical protein